MRLNIDREWFWIALLFGSWDLPDARDLNLIYILLLLELSMYFVDLDVFDRVALDEQSLHALVFGLVCF